MGAETKIKAEQASVYAKIAAVQGELAHTGIGKDSENSFDRYKFRGIDAVYNALAPLLAKHGLCVLPRIIERESVERTSRKGEPMFYVTVTAEFDFVSADDGSVHTVRTYGEAMDRSDKATNKAMSAAYKYAAFMAFAIPTEGDNDADASTPEVEAAARGQSKGGAVSPSQPISDSDWALAVQLLETTGTSAEKVCAAHKIGSLKEMSTDQWAALKPILEKRLAQQAEATREPANA